MFLCCMPANFSHKSEGDRSYAGEGVLQWQSCQYDAAGASVLHNSKIKGGVSLCLEAAAAHLLLTLATGATAARPALGNIMPNQAAAPILRWAGSMPVTSHL
jgi:hypothetical protein